MSRFPNYQTTGIKIMATQTRKACQFGMTSPHKHPVFLRPSRRAPTLGRHIFSANHDLIRDGEVTALLELASPLLLSPSAAKIPRTEYPSPAAPHPVATSIVDETVNIHKRYNSSAGASPPSGVPARASSVLHRPARADLSSAVNLLQEILVMELRADAARIYVYK